MNVNDRVTLGAWLIGIALAVAALFCSAWLIERGALDYDRPIQHPIETPTTPVGPR